MQLPSVERSPNLRPVGADMAAPAAGRVIPVAPVNPSAGQAVQGVVNDINPEVRAQVQAATADPLQGGSGGDNSSRDWTQTKDAMQKAMEPPKEPISKMLIEHIHSLWTASAKAVEVWFMQNQEQIQNATRIQHQVESRNKDPAEIPGVAAKEVLTYSPNKVKKSEKPE